jgi:hypothetical protein
LPPAPIEPPAKPVFPLLAMTPPLVIVSVFKAPFSPYCWPEALLA